ncbi:radical SAM protein [Sphingomonas sp. R-74633]|uniref:radical SAM/SPASM domain-containing protein n=1 Tax=Sphingomonas sp. R-74633 TaxID=2751188 RepID=UPI0017C3E160|nr:radical SAM protein [Sphingomonas sp. R-74633]NYT42431.1 radical SAM protein [Sphingomonas sp. R-74633]
MYEGSVSAAVAVEAPSDESVLELVKGALAINGVAAVPTVLAALAERGPNVADPLMRVVFDEIIAAIVRAFDADPLSPDAYAAFAGIPADYAGVLYDLTLQAIFGDAPPSPAGLTVKGVLCLTGLLTAAGAHERAAMLLSEINHPEQHFAIRHAAWIARCRAADCSTAIDLWWNTPLPAAETIEEAEEAIRQSPLAVDRHRACVRLRLEAGEGEAAIDALCTALALPLVEADKRALAGELATVTAVLMARGEHALIERQRTLWAVALCPQVAAEAAIRLRAGAFPFLHPDQSDAIAKLLLQTRSETGYPMVGGKPHLDTVWLEITNHCNQKCTFCPDMFREEPRTWLPLEQVKALLDDLAANCSVGAVQLNAYGEPLLHPNIAEILAYIREQQLPFPAVFTTHGMTLVDKKLAQLSHNYPSGIAVSLHNDSQHSYEMTRSAKIGDYETMVTRITALIRQMVHERAPSHLRLYQMVSNTNVDMRVDEQTRTAFPDTPARMIAHVRKWEAIAAEIAANAPPEVRVEALVNTDAAIAHAFTDAFHHDRNHLPILRWIDAQGAPQVAFVSARTIDSYANLLFEYDPRWQVSRSVVNRETCNFTATPSLAIFATGKLGICCLDLNSTATFGSLSDYASIADALKSPEALRIFAELSNGVAASRGCQTCLGGAERLCGKNGEELPRPTRPAGHFRDGI